MYIPTTAEMRKPCISAFSIDSIISSKTSPTSHQHQKQQHQQHQHQQPLRHHLSETRDSTQTVRVESGRDEFHLIPNDLFPSPSVPTSPTPMTPDLFRLHRLPPASSFFQHNSNPLYPYTGMPALHQEIAHQRNIPTYFASSRIPVSMETHNERISLGQNLTADPFYAWLAASAAGPHQLSTTAGNAMEKMVDIKTYMCTL